ncbi:(2Fe-2S)-binding protein [Limnovirga soli]|uniref:2Fe-2S iron-sulfur cluster binding domain-containing protein n=1 Tax=Limnovirga soli TaxID=2656915 RepID=A0A8J8FDJ1_9BACT|nr:(2Fe-2S)-binding protein [Limnovirga soli]NNV53911.1 2Fe-2S iron-sulfur cluster binding domain-containing protein [Limnovirga soli]
MPQYKLTVNNKEFTANADAEMPLLWVLRDLLDLTGTKYGCGVASCGACTVLVDDVPVRSCQLQVQNCGSAKITTIEGLSEDGTHPIQQAWEKVSVPQCGYCQAGQIMNVAGLLKKYKQPTEEQINEMMAGNLCRCGTYTRIREAIHSVIEEVNK